MLRLLAFLAALSGPTTSACAMTSAEWLQADRQFAEGVVFGMVEYRMNVSGEDDMQEVAKFGQCIAKSGMTSNTLFDAVAAYIRNNPATLSESIAAPVLRTVLQVCPWGK